VRRLSADGQSLLSDESGVAIRAERFDAHENRLEVSYEDASEKPVASHGHYSAGAIYDPTDKLIAITFRIPCEEGAILEKPFAFAASRLPSLRFASYGADGTKSSHEAFVLQYAMAGGQVLGYAVKAAQERRARIVQRCTRVNADGTADYDIEMLRPDAQPQRMTFTMSRRGRILSASSGPADQLAFPTRPVFVGEVWQNQLQIDQKNPVTQQPWRVNVMTYCELAHVRKDGDAHVADIHISIPAQKFHQSPGVVMTYRGSGDTQFALDEGLLLSTTVAVWPAAVAVRACGGSTDTSEASARVRARPRAGR
jgi:hypothetical protein